MLRDEELEAKNIVLQEVLADTSALLTDYSGISFEYLLLNRPIEYIVGDMSNYTRGFAFDNPLDYMPGEKINTLGELLHFLDDIRINRDKFEKVRERLKEKIFKGNEMKNGAEELIKHLDRFG